MKNIKKEIDIIANSMVEPGLSGGNRIFIEIAKCWTKEGVKINIYSSEVGKDICLGNGLSLASFYTWSIPKFFKRKKVFSRFDIFLLYLLGFINAVVYSKNLGKLKKNIIWTTSDYWPDSLVGIIAKILDKNVFWIGSLFLFAPNPFVGFKEKGSKTLPSIKNIAFYLTQKPIYYLTKKMADLVFVTSQPDKDRFVQAGMEPEKVVVIHGGVDTHWADEYLAKKQKEKKEFEACFMGRFHPQKGVLELIDIWRKVCETGKQARLVMIGDGELMPEVKNKIKIKGLEKNIILKGFLGDGEEKFNIFKKSRIILHPAVYDSGGMAAAEAMAWGLPGVSFDLEALKTYYPSGILKARIGDQKHFAELVLKLLQDNSLYYNTSTQARNLILKQWGWKPKADLLKKIIFDQ
ncbi:hypothetical protein COT64_01360 [Candidatus Shapirobacteria bacterium CG09_land_8_20_14_0_10_39_12]|uniref:Glycosyl transferase family 1 domain-containing protein n=1 Tax=Candidatus Shapirobacteria bacterium CG09_land_8_20_14_0_10_39_12 TaxID=1974885 RepID=A0A2H0WPT9_9BACT|nr:MAG: hypothetical protein COT64_01360 [Candidatus Shapirobacteria bacterium CG09_land_8_20_14_0_10_39_12]